MVVGKKKEEEEEKRRLEVRSKLIEDFGEKYKLVAPLLPYQVTVPGKFNVDLKLTWTHDTAKAGGKTGYISPEDKQWHGELGQYHAKPGNGIPRIYQLAACEEMCTSFTSTG